MRKECEGVAIRIRLNKAKNKKSREKKASRDTWNNYS